VGLIAPLRALPVGAFDAVMDVLGVNATMDAFTGRAPASSPSAPEAAVFAPDGAAR